MFQIQKKPQLGNECGFDVHIYFNTEPQLCYPELYRSGAGNVDKSTQHSPLLPASLQSKLARFDPPITVFYPWTPGKKAVCPAGLAPTKQLLQAAQVMGTSLAH